jgi:hypothetical protein
MANLSGKWYWESVVTADGNQSHWIGVIGASSRYDIRLDNSNTLNQVLYARYDGQKIVNGTISAYGASYIVGDVIGIALDLDIGIVTFYKNNVSQGAISLPTTGIAYTPVFWYSTTATSGTIASNFGQRPFAYAAPSGFKSLNTHNLPALAVAKSNTAFDTVLYTGTGSTQTIGGLNFAPDLVWIKDRSSSVVGHRLYDTIRGATKEIYTHSTSAETTDAAGLTAFTANGFTTGNSAGTNTNGDNLVAWAWDAGTTTVVNTAGSITANVRVNTSAGISIVSYAGSQASTFTIGHGLLSAPSFIITKSRNAVGDWGVYYTNEGVNTNWLLLNSTASKGTQNGTLAGGAYLISNAQTLQIGSSAYANGSSQMIAYCFAAVPGFSAFGTYTGNGSTDGPFVYLGFRPKFLLTKRADSTSNWLISDAVRNSENPVTRELFPNAPDSEPSPNSAYAFDFLSNGVKLRRATDSSLNISGGTYIYAAFAESPFKYARAR